MVIKKSNGDAFKVKERENLSILLDNSPKKSHGLIGLKLCSFLTIRLRAQDFYRALAEEGTVRINYHAEKSRVNNLVVLI